MMRMMWLALFAVLSAVSTALCGSSCENQLQLRLQEHFESASLSHDEAIVVRFKVFYHGPPQDVTLQIEDKSNVFWISKTSVALNEEASQTVSVRLALTHKSTTLKLSDLPSHLTVKVLNSAGESIHSEIIEFQYHKFSHLLERDTAANVLLVGFPGVGKSTFVKTTVSALSSDIQHIQNCGGGDRHVTKRITLYRVHDWNSRVRLNLWDTWGITPAVFNSEFLVDLCNGLVPDGYKMQEYTNGTPWAGSWFRYLSPLLDIKAWFQTPPADYVGSAPHAVIFFLKAAETQNALLMDQMKGHINTITDMGYSPIVAISWLHEIDQKDTRKYLMQVSEMLHIPAHQVLPFIGYVDHTRKNSTVDQNLLKILEHAIAISDMFKKVNAEELERAGAIVKTGNTLVEASFGRQEF